jgi:tetratricopeptide (TPR) repeat protein
LAERRHQPTDTLEELETLGARLAQWVGANAALVLGVAGAVLLAAAAVGGYAAWSRSHADHASAALAELRSGFVEAMGGKPGDVNVPEPANPETARSVRTEYADKYAGFAKEWSGTESALVADLRAGELYLALGNRDRALEVWKDAVANAPTDSPVRGILESRLGHLYEDQGDFAAAAQAHEAAAAVPGYPLRNESLADAARCYDEAGQPEKALAIYRELQSQPNANLPPEVTARFEELAARQEEKGKGGGPPAASGSGVAAKPGGAAAPPQAPAAGAETSPGAGAAPAASGAASPDSAPSKSP